MILIIIFLKEKAIPQHVRHVFSKKQVLKNTKTSECTNKEWMKMEIYFISDSWKLLFFAEVRIRTFHFGIKKTKFPYLVVWNTC